MAKGRITDAAGPTTDFFYFLEDVEPGDASDARIVLEARVADGPFKGKRAAFILVGAFGDGDDGLVTGMRESVGGELHFTLTLDEGVPLDLDALARIDEPLHLVGNRYANLLVGDRNEDRLEGKSGADTLLGLRGDDRLFGGRGADEIAGGGGADRLEGGGGADRFIYGAVSDAAPRRADVIRDFGLGADLIVLNAIDADEGDRGNQRFDFIGRDDFSGTAGELRYERSDGDAHVMADTDGDGAADFEIRLLDFGRPHADDFVL